jgi:hypothetical protein
VVRASQIAEDGRHIVLDDPDGDHRLWLLSPPGGPMMIGLLIDDDFDLRHRAAARLYRRLRGLPAGAAPPGQAVTSFQRSRLTMLLRIFDRLVGGCSKREIACDVIYPGLEAGSAAEWKGSAERRRTQRLCDEAKAMVTAGYRRLLRGR